MLRFDRIRSETWLGVTNIEVPPAEPDPPLTFVQDPSEAALSSVEPSDPSAIQSSPPCSIVQPSSSNPASITTGIAESEQHHALVRKLEETYTSRLSRHLSQWNGDRLNIHDSTSIIMNIFLATQKNDQLTKRVLCYALAKSHPRYNPIDGISQAQLQYELAGFKNIQDKIYHYIRLGRKWKSIVDLFESLLKGLAVSRSESSACGILCVLGCGSVWERAPLISCRTALSRLCAKTNIYEEARRYSHPIARTLRRVLDSRSDRFCFRHHLIQDAHPARTIRPSNSTLKAVPVRRAHGLVEDSRITTSATAIQYFDSVRDAELHWRVAEAVASEALSRRSASQNSKLLLILLSFLANSKVSPELLVRGASPRRRWNERGEVDEISGSQVHLDALLESILSDIARLDNAFCELQALFVVSKNQDQTFTQDRSIREQVLERLPREQHLFWRLQALIIASGSVPWKYLQPSPVNARGLIVPHIQHTLLAVRDHDGFQSIPTSTRTDLILTLVEASRFPNNEWKRCALTQAKEAAGDILEPYIHSSIAQRESLLHRISGDYDKSAHIVQSILLVQEQLQAGTDKRAHAGVGQMVIQNALNLFQDEKLYEASEILKGWRPLVQLPSTMEEIILFRVGILLGKILRFQGAFEESLQCLKEARRRADGRKDLFFNEDLFELASEFGDILRELNRPAEAETLLRSDLARQQEGRAPSRNLARLCLAEALFAQEKYALAETICLEIKSGRNLSKMETLRLCITLAKVRHVQSDLEGAFELWTEALMAMNKFPPTSGHATRVIYLSICNILRRQGRLELERASRRNLATLEKVSTQAEAKFWIAGLRHWLDYLESIVRAEGSRL